MRMVTASLVGLLIGAPVLAQEPLGRPVEPQDATVAQQSQDAQRQREHQVKQGDTLWDLASFYFSNPFQWRRIYEANEDVVEDPHWIYPAEVLIIPGLVDSVEEPEPSVAVRPLDRPLRTVFYTAPPVQTRSSASQPTVLSEPALAEMPVTPGEFRSAPFIADPDDLPVRARMLEPLREMREHRGALEIMHPKDEVFLSYASRERPQVGERLVLVEVVRDVRGAPGGHRMIQPRGIVEVLRLGEDVIQGRLQTVYGPVVKDQLLLPLQLFPDFMVEEAEPVEQGFDLEGELLEFVDDRPLPKPTDRAFIDLGARDGVQPGDIFIAFLPERASAERGRYLLYRDRLPPETVAQLRVIRVTDETATVIVDDLVLPRLEEGMKVRRIRKIP